MKRLILLSGILISTTSYANNGMVCDTDYIKSIQAGVINTNPSNRGGGNALSVTFENGRTYPLHPQYNADDDRGRMLISLLTTAFALRKRVQIVDHAGNNCDDFDMVNIEY
ncbi:hypothetical protein ACMAZD_05735 [Vibrio sp. nBUS_14]|uniref:hypothetical protein n=1 Tax=Vibrio sp. nBUS_14 TaxID=3395321 RepID=UPI003EB89A67